MRPSGRNGGRSSIFTNCPPTSKTREGRIAFLKGHPTLALDARHFSQDFTDRLLASFRVIAQ